MDDLMERLILQSQRPATTEQHRQQCPFHGRSANASRRPHHHHSGRHHHGSSNNRKVPESAEQVELRRSVLKHFKCPFQEEEACRFAANPEHCHFAHVATPVPGLSTTEEDDHLKEVPAYVCIYHLVNSCRNSVASNGNAANSNSPARTAPGAGPSATNQPNHHRPCANGLHLTIEELVDLEFYEKMHKGDIRRLYGRDGERQCGICWDKVLSKRLSRNRRFAILENCDHCFCAGCISSWRRGGEGNVRPPGSFGGSSSTVTCPMCRTVSTRVAYRRRFVTNPQAKAKLFQEPLAPSSIGFLLDPFKHLVLL